MQIHWEYVLQALDLILGSILIGKLWRLGLHRVYRLFCIFLASNLVVSYAWLVQKVLKIAVDYRLLWLSLSLIVWIFTLSTVYQLLNEILKNLPGIAKLSHKVLNFAWIGSIAVGLLSAFLEYGFRGLGNKDQFIIHLSAAGIIVDRVIASVALLVLLAILSFLLWFPVAVRRNIAVFTAGFLIYFAVKTILMLMPSGWSTQSVRVLSVSLSLLSTACFAYWTILITPAGETKPTRLRLSWGQHDGERAMRQLELLDQSLIRAASR